MAKPLNIVIIGAGNLASHLAQSFQSKRNLHLVQIFNHRKTKKALLLAKKAGSEFISDYKKINQNADIYIICVKDDVIEEVCKNLISLKLKGIVVHTSGSTDIQVLKYSSKLTGVFYPLETFYPTTTINWEKTPILIEGNTVKAKLTLKTFAKSISKKVEYANSQNRLYIHLAAVIACNFTNALFVSAFDIIEERINKHAVKLLLPIIHSSVNKLNHVHPKNAQTGPAARNDNAIMNKHLKLISKNKTLSNLYLSFSELISKQQNIKKHGKF